MLKFSIWCIRFESNHSSCRRRSSKNICSSSRKEGSKQGETEFTQKQIVVFLSFTPGWMQMYFLGGFFLNLTRFWTKLRVLVLCFPDFTENSINLTINVLISPTNFPLSQSGYWRRGRWLYLLTVGGKYWHMRLVAFEPSTRCYRSWWCLSSGLDYTKNIITRKQKRWFDCGSGCEGVRSISDYKFLFAANTEKKHKVCFPSFLFKCILFENVAVFACLLGWGLGSFFFWMSICFFLFFGWKYCGVCFGWTFSFFKNFGGSVAVFAWIGFWFSFVDCCLVWVIPAEVLFLGWVEL